MFCCVCAGSCCHTGPHSLCEAHRAPSFSVQFTPCAHCYCQPGIAVGGVLHARCCKCRDERALLTFGGTFTSGAGIGTGA